MRRRHELTDQQWNQIEPLLPRGRGRPSFDDRGFVNAVVWIAKTGAPWRDLPDRYGPWKTTYNRFRNWARKEVWADVFRALAVDDEELGAMMDATIVRAHQDASGGRGGPKKTR